MSGFSGAVALGLMRTEEEEAEERAACAISNTDLPDWSAFLHGSLI